MWRRRDAWHNSLRQFTDLTASQITRSLTLHGALMAIKIRALWLRA
jgi:hypothetical protein